MSTLDRGVGHMPGSTEDGDAGSPCPTEKGTQLTAYSLHIISGMLDHIHKEEILSLLVHGPGCAS